MQYKIVFDCINLNQEQSRKFSKNCQILYRKFKFLVKFEIYITGLIRLYKFRYLLHTYLIYQLEKSLKIDMFLTFCDRKFNLALYIV